jgi:general secretion pathway protein F
MRVRLDIVQGRGAPQVLELDAPSLAEARAQVLRQGFSVLDARSVGSPWRGGFARRHRFDIAVFVEQLHDLLVAGLSVIEALVTLERGASASNASVLAELARRLRSGERLSDALSAQPTFPALLVALVRASELTSDLPQALSRFLDHERRVSELRHRLTSVAIYPLLVTLVGLGVLVFLGLYVMPRFARIFEDMTGPLPWSATAMVWWSQWLSNHGMLLAVGAALVAVMTATSLATPAARRQLLGRLLDLQPLRARLRTYFLARWFRATGMLVDGGIPLPEALRLSNELLPLAMQPGGVQVERAVRDGHTPADAHLRAGMTTPVAEQLMRAGERTGDLGAVLLRIAQFHEAEVARSLERGMRALEPVVMTLIGFGVGAVVILMYLPIFELASTLQ